MTSGSPIFPITRDIDWHGRRVTVMGLGSFGGGIAVVRFFAEHGANVLVSDRKDESALAESIAGLADLAGVEYHLGDNEWSHVEDAELVIVNPAVPPSDVIYRRLMTSGIPCSTEIGLFWQLNRSRVIGVTGSNGKSTTTALTHHVLDASLETGRAWLGGNIGGSLLPRLDEIQPEDWVVLELSSFQLKALDRIRARPDVAVVTNFAPNHLDWHGTLDDYRESKQALLRWQTEDDFCVLTPGEEVADWPSQAQRIHAGNPELPQMRLRGNHNRENAINAVSAVTAAMLIDARDRGESKPSPVALTALSTFLPLPHRLASIAAAAGRTFYDDSIATTPESAIAALNSFDEPIVLLAGGSDKKLDLSEFAAAIAKSVKAVALLGTTGPNLDELISARNPGPVRLQADSFQSAFNWAVEQSSPGDVVLLSPGCASLDWFRNFKDRGEQFTKLATDWCDRLSSGPP